jgi:hypothetical protein
VKGEVSREDVWGFLATTATSRTSCPSTFRGDPTSSEFGKCFSPEKLKYENTINKDQFTTIFFYFIIKIMKSYE